MVFSIKPLSSDGVGGEYWAGTPDGSRPGIFYVNLHKPEYKYVETLTLLNHFMYVRMKFCGFLTKNMST